MRAKAGLLFFLGLFLIIIGTVSAEIADSGSTIISSKEWPVALPMDPATITVYAMNSTPGLHPVVGATVTFTVVNLGEIQGTNFYPRTVTTDSTGKAETTFYTGRTAGIAHIQAEIVGDDGGKPFSTNVLLDQKIDHYLPQGAFFDNPSEMPVGSVGDLNITVRDIWGNRVDDKNISEVHSFRIYMVGSGNGEGLWDGSKYADNITVQTDAYGNASARYRISTLPVVNTIIMEPIGSMYGPAQTSIQGMSESMPCFVSQIHPDPDAIAADGVAAFDLYFQVLDQYGNPVNSTPVLITASDGSSMNTTTNIAGYSSVTFGPKDRTGDYMITSVSLKNASAICKVTNTTGYCEQKIGFYNTSPVDMSATGNPIGMASFDVDSTSKGTVQARVMDIKGNSVVGEDVYYSLGTPTYPGGPFNVTSAPKISATSAKTALGGFSTITFTPGGFSGIDSPDYNATATGQVTVTATWTDPAGTVISHDVTFIWKNYPYLGMSVCDQMCEDVKVGDKVNITVKLTGDGAALKPKPIDVVLVTDVSLSMAGTKIAAAKNADQIFAASMSTQDRVGLESYGHKTSGSTTWPSYAKDDLPLTFISPTSLTTINSKINTYAADYYTPMRPAIYNATNLIKYNNRSGAVKAIVLLTDGEWNTAGDPTGATSGNACKGTTDPRMAFTSPVALGATDSVITYANQSGIRIYTVGLEVTDCTNNSLTSYAAATGGKNYRAPSSAELATIYQQIAGDLQETAGGSATVTMNFSTVKINDMLDSNVTDYMTYVPDLASPIDQTSTLVNKTNVTKTGVMNIIYKYTQDDSTNWSNHKMVFDVGDMKLNETWATTFRVNLTKAGKVTLFPPESNSKLCFTDASTHAETCQAMIPCECPVKYSKTNVGFGNSTIWVANLTPTIDAGNPDYITIQWDITFDGTKTNAEQTLSYQDMASDNAPWINAPASYDKFVGTCQAKHNSVTMGVSSLIPGHQYHFRIKAFSNEAPNGKQQDDAYWTKPGQDKTNYIQLS
jgi:hypothetical protein